MSEFTASNGQHLSREGKGGGVWLHESVTRIAEKDVHALREFFVKENDDRLGRWRFPENPDCVVYPWPIDPARREVRGVTVLSERIPRPYTVWEDRLERFYGESVDEASRKLAREAARAYFDAHPEPKPTWHDAKPGEVWILSHDGGDEYPFGVGDGAYAGDFVYAGGESYFPITDPKITTGRRIWPEVQS